MASTHDWSVVHRTRFNESAISQKNPKINKNSQKNILPARPVQQSEMSTCKFYKTAGFGKPWQVTILQVQFNKTISQKNFVHESDIARIKRMRLFICKTRNIFLQLQGKICTFMILHRKTFDKNLMTLFIVNKFRIKSKIF